LQITSFFAAKINATRSRKHRRAAAKPYQDGQDGLFTTTPELACVVGLHVMSHTKFLLDR